jgi:hypothetical protein
MSQYDVSCSLYFATVEKCSGEQIDVTKSMEEVKNQEKERTVNQIRTTPIEEFYTHQAIKLQDVVLYNNVEGETLKTNVDSARVNIRAGEVLANTSGVTITKRENGTSNEDCDYWKVRPPPKRIKEIKDDRREYYYEEPALKGNFNN